MSDAVSHGPEDAFPLLPRQRFLQKLLGVLITIGTIGGLIPIVAFVWPPKSNTQTAEESFQPLTSDDGKAITLADVKAAGTPVMGVLTQGEKQTPVAVIPDALNPGWSKPYPEVISRVCPHLGCTVAFRTDEHKADDGETFPNGFWQCPCHRSQFPPNGSKVLGGPAPRPMFVFQDVAIAKDDITVKGVAS
ncbi:MAG TPA: Rieske 2Fe-2S domain-containing protein [Candidatus Dormibacteraeota bacterium]|nr:Rieske 2Fe-2S domain-containing protein [Candidatus Dormibacteraeota bacterium]